LSIQDPAGSPSRLREHPAIRSLLTDGYETYLELVRRAASHPDNRPGADKTWVERAMREYQEHYRKASRKS
jgi:hypothetical protein